jgi:hypothetical protein
VGDEQAAADAAPSDAPSGTPGDSRSGAPAQQETGQAAGPSKDGSLGIGSLKGDIGHE